MSFQKSDSITFFHLISLQYACTSKTMTHNLSSLACLHLFTLHFVHTDLVALLNQICLHPKDDHLKSDPK